MDPRALLSDTYRQAGGLVEAHFADFTEAEMLIRPFDNANHAAWMLGHLVTSSANLTNMMCPDTMSTPSQEETKRYSTEGARLNEGFLSKDELLRRFGEMNECAIKWVEKLTDAEMDKELPEKLQGFAPTIGHLAHMLPAHVMMHLGQVQIIRRKLGKPVLFQRGTSMPSEITMPQQSDTMTEGTVVRWLKKEGDKVKEGEVIAEIETDKATMEMEAFESGTIAVIAVPEGQKVPVGAVLAVIATGKEDPAQIKASHKTAGAGAAAPPLASSRKEEPPASQPQSAPAKPQAVPSRVPTQSYNYDLVVIGGGPGGYAAAIRAGQLKKKVLCIEKENLGGTCLNWGCIPTKALLEDGAFIRKLRTEAAEHGVTVENIKLDFPKIVGRSRTIAQKLQRGVGALFSKYKVEHVLATGQLLGPHKVRYSGKDGSKEVTADHVILAVGAKPTQLPGMEFDGKMIIGSREAMTLPQLPKRMAIIGAGAIGCEFADFYNAVGAEVVLIEMLPQLLPIEDDDVSLALKRSFEKRGIKVHLKTKTEKVEKASAGLKLTLSGDGAGTVETDILLVAAGVTANTQGLADAKVGLEMDRARIKVSAQYKTNLENVWAIGDCIAMPDGRHPDLAHVAHHEAVYCVERMFGVNDHEIDYRFIPGCTYTHPQVASMGLTEKKAREKTGAIRIGKFPFNVSGRALAAGETEGFVKLIFDAQYGELLGAHLIGENVTELLSELVLARNVEATEDEIIQAMHPHPTMSEAVMEAAGVAVKRSIHL